MVRFSRKPREEKGGKTTVGVCLQEAMVRSHHCTAKAAKRLIKGSTSRSIGQPSLLAVRGHHRRLANFRGQVPHGMPCHGSQCSSGPVQSDSGWWVLLAVPSCSLDLGRIDCIALHAEEANTRAFPILARLWACVCLELWMDWTRRSRRPLR